jgi:hypothetical protein
MEDFSKEFIAESKCSIDRPGIELDGCRQLTKTDQGSNSTTLVIYKQPHIAVCPVKLMNLYLNKRLSLSADICKADDTQLYIHFDATLLTRYNCKFSRYYKPWRTSVKSLLLNPNVP